MTKKKVDELFFQLFSEKNSDGTRHLRLRGKELYQRFNYRLDQNHMIELAKFLRKFPETTSLDLSYNDIGNEGIKILAENYFNEPNNLKRLNLLHCDIDAEGLQYLSQANLSLKSLRLVGNRIGDSGARFIGTILDQCTELEDLDIGETDQTYESIQAILIVIEKSTLISLNISRIIPKTYYTQLNTQDFADDIGILMKLNTSLEVLRVQKCSFDGHEIEVLVDGLKFHKNLSMLDLGANRFGDHGVIFLANWLKTRPPLIGLRIPANDITAKGASLLAMTLPCSRLRFLDLQNNKISDDGVSELLYSSKKGVPMRMFFVWGNHVGPRAVKLYDRLIWAGVLEQENIDVKIYSDSDGVRQAAYYPANNYVNNSYSVWTYGAPPELKIVNNQIVSPDAQPRALINFDFINRYPKAVVNQDKSETSFSIMSWEWAHAQATKESFMEESEDRICI